MYSLTDETLTSGGLAAELIRPIVLADGAATADIWCVDTAKPLSAFSSLDSLLLDGERGQAQRFHDPSTRRRFVIRRAARRLILSDYTNAPAPESAASLREDGTGKPRRGHGRDIRFSCAASGDLALIGVAHGRRIGVDLERLQTIPDALEIAVRFFALREAEAVSREPASRRSASFLRIWTCKEAWVKAKGAGFGIPFDSFEIGGDPPPKLARVDGDPQAPDRWVIQSFVPAPGFLGAVAVESSGPKPPSVRRANRRPGEGAKNLSAGSRQMTSAAISSDSPGRRS